MQRDPRLLMNPVTRRHLFANGAKVAGGSALALGLGGAVGLGLPGGALAQQATPMATPEPGQQFPYNDQMQAVLDKLAELNQIPIPSQEPFNARQLPLPNAAVAALLAEEGQPALEQVGSVTHRLLPGGEGEVVARVYTPAGTGPFPVIVYFHGGGWVIANLDTYDSSCRALTNAAEAVVVSVAYRQAPENPYPIPVQDAYAALQHVMENAAQYGGDSERVAVAGESAGGNMATVCCLTARDQGGLMPVHQLLVYPVTTFAPEGEAAESIAEYGMAMPLTEELLLWFGEYYLPEPMEPEASPLMAEDLSGLPPATVINAQIDVLASQGRLYAEALEAAGNDVTHSVYEGVTHEFFGMGAVVDEAAAAVEEAATRLQAAFGG